LAACACILVTIVYAVLQPFPNLLYYLSNTVEAAFSFIPLFMAAFSLKMFRGDRWFARVDTFLLVGFLFWSLGESTWSFYALYLNIAVPYPSVADVFWLAGYPFVLMGIIAFLSPFKNAINRRNLLISSVVSITAAALVIVFLVLPVFTFSTDIISSVVGLAYPLLDILLLFASVMAVLLFWGGKLARGFYWLVAGMLLTSVGDILFSYLTATGAYYDGHPLELLYEFEYTCFGLAIYERFRGLWS